MNPAGTSPGPNRDAPSPFVFESPGNSSSIPEGTLGAPVARATTSSLFPPTDEGSKL